MCYDGSLEIDVVRFLDLDELYIFVQYSHDSLKE